MKLRTSLIALAMLTILFFTCHGTASSATRANDSPQCQVTKPNGSTPPGERPGPNFHGGDGLWTALWRDGTVVLKPGGPGFVLEDGSLSMKFPWWREVKGKLTVEGRRLDGSAPRLRARIPDGYGDTGFQATALIFPTEGCWEITGRVGEANLTFVTLVVKIGDGPRRPRSR